MNIAKEKADCQYSIIICTRNRCSILKRVLAHHASLMAGQVATTEFIIVDNGSTDSTKEVVADFAAKVHCNVGYLFESRLGHSVALNAACRLAVGQRLLFTDDDTLPYSTWFSSVHEAFETLDADWVYGPIIPKWEYGRQPSWYGPETAKYLACLDLGDQMLVGDQVTTSFAGANHACRRDRIEELGWYDESLGLRGDALSFGGNDDDLFFKARRSNFRIVYHPKAGVEHIISENRYHRSNHRGNSWIVGKNQYAFFSQDRESKRLLGLPRYLLRSFGTHGWSFLVASLTNRKSQAFFHEIQVIRMTGLYWTAFRRWMKGDPS